MGSWCSVKDISGQMAVCLREHTLMSLWKVELNEEDYIQDPVVRLTNMVRECYVHHLEQVLQKNLAVCYGSNSENTFTGHDIERFAGHMELRALRLCMVASLYQKAMVEMVADVKKHTNELKVYNKFKDWLKERCFCKDTECKETQTEPVGIKVEANVNVFESRPVYVKSEDSCDGTGTADTTVQTPHAVLTDSRASVFTFSADLSAVSSTVDCCGDATEAAAYSVAPASAISYSAPPAASYCLPPSVPSYCLPLRGPVLQRSPLVGAPSNSLMNEALNVSDQYYEEPQENGSMDSFSSNEEFIANSPSKTTCEESNTVNKMDFTCEEMTTINKMDFYKDTGPQLEEEDEAINQIKMYLNFGESDKPDFDSGTEELLRILQSDSEDEAMPEYAVETSKNKLPSFWSREKEMQKAVLHRRISKYCCDPAGKVKMKNRFFELFGYDSEEEDVWCSKDAVSKYKQRIAPYVVQRLLPYYRQKRVLSKHTFKCVASHIAERILCISHTPEEKDIERAITVFFSYHGFISSSEDIWHDWTKDLKF